MVQQYFPRYASEPKTVMSFDGVPAQEDGSPWTIMSPVLPLPGT